MKLSPDHLVRLRREVLQHVYNNHAAQMHRLQHLTLLDILRRRGYSTLGERDIITVLQDLCDRKYLTCETEHDDWSGDLLLKSIEITPVGRNLVEGFAKDEAVGFGR
ncbi:hypothetical protein [Terriglobus sp. RCC_193]|uniref:hypothetical protein n=1 Tax=Terriglobus sp. RCC_193 TaxID=3239218 RepID=UPI0035249203